jgi:hypothetical protein
VEGRREVAFFFYLPVLPFSFYEESVGLFIPPPVPETDKKGLSGEKVPFSLLCNPLCAVYVLRRNAERFSPGGLPLVSASSQARVCADTPRGFAHCMAIQLVSATTTHAKPGGGGPQGLNPVDLQSAYKLPSSSAGSGQTVAIVDAYIETCFFAMTLHWTPIREWSV